LITLRINGRSVELPQPMSLLDYLEQKGVNAKLVAVEINERILPRQELTEATLGDGDVVEIVRMVGGG